MGMTPGLPGQSPSAEPDFLSMPADVPGPLSHPLEVVPCRVRA